MSTASKVIAQTGKHTDRQTDTHRYTDTTKTLPPPHTWELITSDHAKISDQPQMTKAQYGNFYLCTGVNGSCTTSVPLFILDVMT